jgi:S-adenosylmethionine decarboxylase
MAVINPISRLRLKDFNNLSKTLSFNIYDINYARTEEQLQ